MRHIIKFLLIIIQIALIVIIGYLGTIYALNNFKGPTFYLNSYMEYTIKDDYNPTYFSKGDIILVGNVPHTNKADIVNLMNDNTYVLAKYSDNNNSQEIGFVKIKGYNEEKNTYYIQRECDSNLLNNQIKPSEIYGVYVGKFKTPCDPMYFVFGAGAILLILNFSIIHGINKQNKRYEW